MELSPSFHLENVVKEKSELVDFEGPLSLILLLLQKDKIEIRDLKIAEILDQYLAFLDTMEKLDLEVASEFVQMASYLLLIKTKMLLSQEEEVSELEILMESLEQLKAKDAMDALCQVSPALQEAYKTGVLIYSKMPEPLPREAGEYQYQHDTVQLLEALRSVFLNSNSKPVDTVQMENAIPKRVVYSIMNKSRQIIKKLRLRDVSLKELYAECRTKSEIVATFVSVLELCSHGSIVVTASKDGKGYDLSFAGGNIDEVMEKIELEYE